MQQWFVLSYRIVVVELIPYIHRFPSQTTIRAIFYRRKVLPNIVIIPIVAQIRIFRYVETLAMIILCRLQLLMGGVRIALVNAVVIVLAHRHQFTIVVLLVFAVIVIANIVLMLQQIWACNKIITFLFGIIFAGELKKQNRSQGGVVECGVIESICRFTVGAKFTCIFGYW